MRKLILCLCAYLVTGLSFKTASADEARVPVDEMRVINYINRVYEQIDFQKSLHLSKDVFATAYKGYLNLLNANMLNSEKHVITICDFSLPSTQKRMWVIDLDTKKVLFNTFVAHGQGTGDDMAESFSNNFDSHQSSLGFYVTSETYCGEHGLSLKLKGMDNGFNDAAMDRGIVVHGAYYVSEKFIAGNERLGRSWGCPAVPDELKVPIINATKDGTCLFIYYPERKYLASSYWLTKKITLLPENSMYPDFSLPTDKPKAKTRVIQYITNGKIDSTITIPLLN